MNCPVCGQELALGAAFCQHCGAKLNGYCSICGKPLVKNDRVRLPLRPVHRRGPGRLIRPLQQSRRGRRSLPRHPHLCWKPPHPASSPGWKSSQRIIKRNLKS